MKPEEKGIKVNISFPAGVEPHLYSEHPLIKKIEGGDWMAPNTKMIILGIDGRPQAPGFPAAPLEQVKVYFTVKDAKAAEGVLKALLGVPPQSKLAPEFAMPLAQMAGKMRSVG